VAHRQTRLVSYGSQVHHSFKFALAHTFVSLKISSISSLDRKKKRGKYRRFFSCETQGHARNRQMEGVMAAMHQLRLCRMLKHCVEFPSDDT
jgi:hypothetical protein